MNMELAIEKVAAIFYFLLALSFLVNPKLWVAYVEEWRARKATINDAFLFFHLMLSILIIVFHNSWYWNTSVAITIIGWIGLTKIAIYLMFPNFLTSLIPKWKNFDLLFRIDGLCGVLLMGHILYKCYALP